MVSFAPLLPIISLVTLSFFISNVNSECVPECDTDAKEFCGLDNKCYPYSCENWYQHGDFKYTRHRTLEAPALTCRDIDVEEEGSYEYRGVAGIVYGCNIFSGVRKPFTRECTAALDDLANFTCREMSPNTDFQPFIDEVSSKNMTCTNENDVPLYMYANWIGFDTFVGESSISSFSLTKTFNSSVAGKTIYSSLVAHYPNGPPNITDPNGEDPNGSSQAIYSKVLVWMVIFICTTILL